MFFPHPDSVPRNPDSLDLPWTLRCWYSMRTPWIQRHSGPQMHFESAGIVVEGMHANLLAGLMKLSGREDRNKKHKSSMFTFIMSYKYSCSSLVFSCYRWLSTSYTDIVSKIKSNQQSYDCSLRFWRARDSSLSSSSSRRARDGKTC